MTISRLIPLGFFIALCAVFLFHLFDKTPSGHVPSALIDRPAPALSLTPIDGIDTPLLTDTVMGDSVVILNVWASWCPPCRAEHPQIIKIGEMEGVTLVGINQKDKAEKATRFLDQLGNPYDYLGADIQGKVSLQYGVYGLPETFVIDKNGIIRAKFVGGIMPEILKNDVSPLIRKLRREAQSLPLN